MRPSSRDKGKMLGDLRILAVGPVRAGADPSADGDPSATEVAPELLLDTERGGAAGAVRHDPPLQGRVRGGAAQAHVGSAAALT